MQESKKKKQRLDLLLVERNHAPTRAKAQALIMGGVVYVDGVKVDKAGTLFNSEVEISVKDSSIKYVGRGGLKLEAALDHFDINVKGDVAVDIGASTGGFTDCLLQRGASRVYAIDVGYGQLDWKLRDDPRVVVMERVNARSLSTADIPEAADIIVIDVSFISLTKIIPAAVNLLKTNGILIALIKPQFEVGKGEVGKGGIVRDEAKHARVVEKICEHIKEHDFSVLGVIPSPILGAEGNKEFLIAGTKNDLTNR